MKNLGKSIYQILMVKLLLMLTISACNSGKGVDPGIAKGDPIKAFFPLCAQAPTDTEQTCAIINEREVITYVPTSQNQYAGIAIFLHGASGSPEKVSNIFGAKMIADKFNLVSVAPKGNSWLYEWNSTNDSSADARDVDHLLAIIDDVQSQYSFIDNKVYIFGYSAGGFMAYKLACQIPERLTAMISLAGQYRGDFDHCATSSPMAIHHLHSETDLDVPYNGRSNGNIASVTQTIEFWQQKNACGTEKTLLIQAGVTESSTKTDTEIYTNCVKSIGLSRLNLVSHEDYYRAEKLLATYEYLL